MKTRKQRHLLFVILLIGNSLALAISEHTETLKLIDWPEYVNGSSISALPQVNEILSRFQEDEKISIEIRYPSGEQGREWAESLLNWFITFGVPLSYLELLPGSGASDQLVVALIDRR